MAGRSTEDEPRSERRQRQVDDVHPLECPDGQRSAHDERHGPFDLADIHFTAFAATRLRSLRCIHDSCSLHC